MREKYACVCTHMKNTVHSAQQILEAQPTVAIFYTTTRTKNTTCKTKNPVARAVKPLPHWTKDRKLPFIMGLEDGRDFNGHDLASSVQQRSKVWQRAVLKAACWCPWLWTSSFRTLPALVTAVKPMPRLIYGYLGISNKNFQIIQK